MAPPAGPRRPPRRGRIGPEARRRRSGRAWFQLLFLVGALVVLLFFMSQIGERSAGCFVQLTGSDAGGAAADTGAPEGDDAPAKPAPIRVRPPGPPPSAPYGNP